MTAANAVGFNADELAGLRAALLGWYDHNARDLPWRRRAGQEIDPYHVWLSEVMLQQTRVETVRPYFLRWLGRFPDLHSLAAASTDEVLKQWEGLGYYSRARNFHAAVREVAERYGGRVPDDPDIFRSLPGVGRYTAGAVMSIAYGREEPVVDGNVKRVYARLADEPVPPDSSIWGFAAQLVRGSSRPGDLNQALMELGATVCTPRRPRCADCPVHRWCRAAKSGTVEMRPERRRKPPLPREVHGVAVVVAPDGRVLLKRRPARGRLGGMWEFPGDPSTAGEGSDVAALRAVVRAIDETPTLVRPLGAVAHTFSHVVVRYEAYLATVRSCEAGSDTVAWESPGGLHNFAMPVAQRKIAALAREVQQ